MIKNGIKWFKTYDEGKKANPYIKVIGCLCVYLCVPKDLAKCGKDMVLLYSEDSYRSREGLYNYFGEVYNVHLFFFMIFYLKVK